MFSSSTVQKENQGDNSFNRITNQMKEVVVLVVEILVKILCIKNKLIELRFNVPLDTHFGVAQTIYITEIYVSMAH